MKKIDWTTTFVWFSGLSALVYLSVTLGFESVYIDRNATVAEYREVMDAATLHRKSGDMWLATIITDFLKADGELSYEDIQYLREKREEIERKYITKFFLDGTYPYNTGGIGRDLNGRPNPIGQAGSENPTTSSPQD